MTDMAIPWDAIADGINARLPEWASYSGYGTWALAAYVYVALSIILGSLTYLADMHRSALGLTAFGVVALLLANYWRGAAKLRVGCSHCGENARGENICPHCGERSYMDGESV